MKKGNQTKISLLFCFLTACLILIKFSNTLLILEGKVIIAITDNCHYLGLYKDSLYKVSAVGRNDLQWCALQQICRSLRLKTLLLNYCLWVALAHCAFNFMKYLPSED